MRIFRFGEFEQEKPGVELVDGTRIDVSAFEEDYTEKFFGTDGLARLAAWVEANADSCPKVPADVRIGSCIARPSKIVCIGLNYAKHAEETNAPIPKEPIIFFKSTTALCGPYDNVIIPKNSVKTDWEVELAVVIGKKASYVSEEEALDYVAGYALHNDYSEREFQIERGGQWVKGKSADTFAPLGPFLATKDEIENPHNLPLWLTVNGEKLQNSSTDDMIFKIPFLIHYLSQFMTLLPGDVISTGTPFGVGLGFKPPRYLKAGDVVELGIDGLGTQKQVAVDYSKN
ncbi:MULTISPECIES: fumarylacetoacetate hydrolase family protein [unclassified Emticicia]|uniref:fumarylacetoacetate hydrolase family protein n=1 Tax=unclassified Emticicia TaxID=2627301 RepID=UPI000C77405B|nr:MULTISPECIES: fumarylacetoacetate hydrolase family protein [unclassified Emticicia]PLK45802.1 ureidoglycolate lyase [Emticicia sp. TH156]UTA67572.1 fumarylacetoacetate hydrolase family protein [Emticicia sp. 21SJ11W-3]